MTMLTSKLMSSSGAGGMALVKTLESTNPIVDGNFGAFVDGSDDYFCVTAPEETAGGFATAGRVYIYNADFSLRHTVISPNAQLGGRFGEFVDQDNTSVLIGASQEEVGGLKGAVYQFNLSTGALEQTYLGFSSANNNYGNAGAISTNYVAIGEANWDGAQLQQGRVAIYARFNGAFARFIENPDAGVNDLFGFDMASDGNNLVVSALNGGVSDQGKVWLVNQSNGATIYTTVNPNFYGTPIGGLTAFGYATGINSTHFFASEISELATGYTATGIIYAFLLSTGARDFNVLLPLEYKDEGFTFFTRDMRVNDDFLIGRVLQFRAWPYVVNGSVQPILAGDLANPDPQPTNSFAASVAITGSRFIVSDKYATSGGFAEAGKVYIYG